MDPTLKVLVIEDDADLGKSIQTYLEAEKCECVVASDGARAAELARGAGFDVAILELALKNDSGLGVLRCLREVDANISILMLSPLDFAQERLKGLEAGADDFLIKPFSNDELLARVRAAVVKSRVKPRSQLEVGPLRMDLTARRVNVAGKPTSLTPTEFRILELLMRNQNQVVTRRTLCEFLWNPDWEGVTNVIEVHMNRLRSKLAVNGTPKLIYTVRGRGYMLRCEAHEAASLQGVSGQQVSG